MIGAGLNKNQIMLGKWRLLTIFNKAPASRDDDIQFILLMRPLIVCPKWRV